MNWESQAGGKVLEKLGKRATFFEIIYQSIHAPSTEANAENRQEMAGREVCSVSAFLFSLSLFLPAAVGRQVM